MDQLTLLHAKVAETLSQMSKWFKPRCKLSFIMRDPKNTDAFVLISDDSEDELIALLERSKKLKQRELTPADVMTARLLGGKFDA